MLLSQSETNHVSELRCFSFTFCEVPLDFAIGELDPLNLLWCLEERDGEQPALSFSEHSVFF